VQEIVIIVMSENTTHQLINAFNAMAGANRQASHAYASQKIIANMKVLLGIDVQLEFTSWGDIPAESIKKHSQTLLANSNELIESMIPENVKQFLN